MVKQENVLVRHNYKNRNAYYDVYKFYGNGCYNIFTLSRNESELTKQMFDPTYTGWRGVLYKKKDKILGDLITQVGGMSWDIGKQTQEFSIKGDTLFAEVKNRYKYVYIKRQIDLELLKHNADW